MIHTMELICTLQQSEYDHLRENLPYLREISKFVSVTNYYLKKGFSELEIIRESHPCRVGIRTRYYLKIRVNLAVLMGEEATFILDDSISAEQITERFFKRIYEVNELRYIKLHQMPVSAFRVARVDFAKDIRFSRPELLVSLCNQIFPYKFYKMVKVLVRGKSIEVQNSESAYFRNRSRTVNIYHKGAEILNNHRLVSEAVLNRALETVRVEFQLETDSIYRLAKSLDISREPTIFLDNAFSSAYLYEEAVKIFGAEKFVSERAAGEIIDNSGFSGFEKRLLKETIKDIRKFKGRYYLEEAIDKKRANMHRKYGNLEKFRKILNKFKQLNIQPSAIPDSYGIDEIPSIADLLSGGQIK